MPTMIKLTGTNGEIWINASKILYMRNADGETAVFCEGSSVAIFVREEPKEINRRIEAVIDYLGGIEA